LQISQLISSQNLKLQCPTLTQYDCGSSYVRSDRYRLSTESRAEEVRQRLVELQKEYLIKLT
jgi:hypothetical protein